ncbi:MAG: hypothetical protein IJ237_12210 [Oscillospiraceae bacterium]|nr:hypothetical protein [Oscillospiraceae bacterium]
MEKPEIGHFTSSPSASRVNWGKMFGGEVDGKPASRYNTGSRIFRSNG